MQRRDLIESAATGAVTFVWYAMPDVVPSRTVRGVAKTGLLAVLAAMGVADGRRLKAEQADARAAAVGGEVTAPDDGALERIRALTATTPVLDSSVTGADGVAAARRTRAILVAAGAVVATAIVGGSLAAERGIHRYGLRLGARGVRRPHTRIGVVSGLAAAVLAAGTAALADRADDA